MAHGVERQMGVVSAMLEPRFYPHPPPAVELRETNTSWVFLAGDLAYKVKKAVGFPFLDYGTAGRRHEMCREEIRLNRRLAPRIYLRVVGIAREGDRYLLTAEDESNAVEYAIEMRRVEEERSLEALIRDGRLEPGDVDPVARRLARFHADAAVAPRRFRRTDVLVESLEENLRTLRDAGDGILAAGRLDAARSFTHAFMAANRRRLEARARGGMVRECHGDLRAEHVIVPAHGDVYVYDCVEFNPGLRNIDVASDLSFLIMDLARLGADDIASRLLAVYRRSGGDPGGDPLIAFFASFRAWVRAKVACLAARAAANDSERTRSEVEARELLRLGHRFAWSARGPLVLAICGVAGSGKSTLAGELGAASGWPQVSSDLTRKRLAGVPPAARAGPRHYSSEFTGRTYGEMGRSARRLLEQGAGVIVDATFHRHEERDAFRAGLGHPYPRLLFVECRAPAEILAARVDSRRSKPDRVSDADQAIVKRQLDELEPLQEVRPRQRIQLTTDVPVQELLGEVEACVDQLIKGSK